MPSAKFEELFSKVKQLDGDPSNEQLLNVRAPPNPSPLPSSLPLSLSLSPSPASPEQTHMRVSSLTQTNPPASFMPGAKSQRASPSRANPDPVSLTRPYVHLCSIPSSLQCPNMFNLLQGRYKYDAWKKAEDEGLSAEEAEQKYIALAEELIARIGLKAPGQA
ncbi:uncharacterized protein EI97DRAFT_434051 [Westerdykella ornata]|uniref:ACB domain-containing protein n=1 Tax=Westerdykella ornata TaxID=318751 RepID=A0A6A6JL59_WESOR|nr:uncharacterized protein EI97DRAFT_434051 [Westerdykella ornata]KAF2275639.1 hypothetical protein EI97DRAFT_434051 [Westerdykella ornata]